jgi:dTMP kinase
MPVPVTPKAAAVLYGLDRLESVSFIAQQAATNDVVIFDRYIASNMVYQASKVAAEDAVDLMHWIFRLETEMFGVAPPDLSIYLDTPLVNATELMLLKGRRSYTDRQHDEHEADTALQRNVRRYYATVASAGLAGPWRVVRTVSGNRLRPPQKIALEIVDHVLELLAPDREDARERAIISRA